MTLHAKKSSTIVEMMLCSNSTPISVKHIRRSAIECHLPPSPDLRENSIVATMRQNLERITDVDGHIPVAKTVE